MDSATFATTWENIVIPDGWSVVYTKTIPKREAKYSTLQGLDLSDSLVSWINETYPAGIFVHQRNAIEAFLNDQNVALATRTASGKTLPFQTAALQLLIESPRSNVLAIYPLKALAREQEGRWYKAIHQAGLNIKVGRIDGAVPSYDRERILRECRIVIATPDVIHASLLPKVGEANYRAFWKHLRLMIVDEVHTYTGVFGSNSAYLFRRIMHVCAKLQATPHFFVASATISDAQQHLRNLFGCDFFFIPEEENTAPVAELNFALHQPPKGTDFLTSLGSFIMQLIDAGERVIVFVDSRKLVEHIALHTARGETDRPGGGEDNVLEEAEEQVVEWTRNLAERHLLPYRSGYEETDREAIEKALNGGELRGVVSTSALELGLDIPGLTAALLVGVPDSATSFWQRVGRVGRSERGSVYVVNDGSPLSQAVFADPPKLFERPLTKGALYLLNKNIQYIQAMCVAGSSGEDTALLHGAETPWTTSVQWPDGFNDLCAAEKVGEVPAELRALSLSAGDSPQRVFPLRDIDVQFQVVLKQGQREEMVGRLSYRQMMREAYPGAVYYYMTQALRVNKIDIRGKRIYVRPERRYFTKPSRLPVQLYPNFQPTSVLGSYSAESLKLVECESQVREVLIGFSEKRGPNSFEVLYPLDAKLRMFFDAPRFSRTFFTTGVFFTWPALNDHDVQPQLLAQLILEALLICIPFERRDINAGATKVRVSKFGFDEGQLLVAVYDETYGSLRLSRELTDPQKFVAVVRQAVDLLPFLQTPPPSVATVGALAELLSLADKEWQLVSYSDSDSVSSQSGTNRVICPGSSGIAVQLGNLPVKVTKVFYEPQTGLRYRIEPMENESNSSPDLIRSLPIDQVVGIPEETTFGLYSFEDGEVRSCE